MSNPSPSPPHPDAVHLTREGRQALEARASELRLDVLPMLVASGGSTDWSRIERQRAAAELARIESVLARAVPAERLPDDPLVVELGETVTIRLADDVMESYVIVDPSEVLVSGEQWVSSRSPLGRALLGRRVGDEVDVAAPGGVYRCIIDGATRP